MTAYNEKRDEIMDWIQEYLWAPLVPVAVWLWTMLHRHDKEISEVQTAQEGLTAAVDEARTSRKAIYDKIETVRTELSTQHEQLRKDQRDDFKDLHKAIAGLGK